MSVIIPSDYLQKDFKPSYCKKCPLTTYVMTNTNEKIRCPFFAYLIDKDCNNKACPLVELPEHGRLIDADKLRMKYEYGAERKKVDDAPTVLEASED